MTGSRACTSTGAVRAARVAQGAAARGEAVISTSGYGVDAAALRTACDAGGPVVAVVATGIDLPPHPVTHAVLLEQVAGSGLVVTTAPPGASPSRARFAAHARLVAALGSATVLVEAGRYGGAMSTAAWAARLHRPVGAVPPPAGEEAAATWGGCRQLLDTGTACLVAGPDDLPDLLLSPTGSGTAHHHTGEEVR